MPYHREKLIAIEGIVFPGYQWAELDGGEQTYNGCTEREG